MSGIKDDGGPAFAAQTVQWSRVPNGYSPQDGVTETTTKTTGGMSLRDYFAAQALAGMFAYYNGPSGDFHTNSSAEKNAEYAYEQADAMLKARSA